MSGALAAWIEGGARRELRGHGIFVRAEVVAGRPPLLLVHGFPTASYDWHLLWPRLAERWSLYALDLLGFGLSEKPRGCDYPIALQADLCAALLEERGVAEAHVLAHDYGDTVAQELLAREREGRLRLGSVAFLNGGLFPEAHRARPIQRLLALPLAGPLLARAMTYAKFEANMLAISGRRPPAREDLADLWSLLERDDGRVAAARLLGYLKQRRRNRARWVGALVDSRVARKFICGEADPVSGAAMAARWRELVPAADVALLEGVGHYPQLEAPERVLEEYFAFRDAAAR